MLRQRVHERQNVKGGPKKQSKSGDPLARFIHQIANSAKFIGGEVNSVGQR